MFLKINEKSIFFIFCSIKLKVDTNDTLIGPQEARVPFCLISAKFWRYLPQSKYVEIFCQFYGNQDKYFQKYIKTNIRKCWSLGNRFLSTSRWTFSACRVIYKVDHQSYDRAKAHKIRQNLFAWSFWSSKIFTKPSSMIL